MYSGNRSSRPRIRHVPGSRPWAPPFGSQASHAFTDWSRARRRRKSAVSSVPGPALSHTVADHQVCTTPAPTQGALLLQNLAVYEAMAGDVSVRSAEGIHILSEIINQTYAWRLGHLCDPRFRGDINPLDTSFLAEIMAGVNRSYTSPCGYLGYYSEGDTTHFVIAVSQESGQ